MGEPKLENKEYEPNFRNTNDYQRKKSAGFSLVGLIVGLPLFMSLFLGVLMVCQNLKQFTVWESQCLHVFYSAFDRISVHANNLLRLNPKAQQLRTKHRIARAQLLAALATGNAVRILMRERQLAQIESQQSLLGEQQQRILRLISFEYSRLPVSARDTFGEKFENISLAEFAIRADQPQDLAPIYVVPPNLKSQNRSQLSYRLEKYPQTCAISLAQRGSIIRATLSD